MNEVGVHRQYYDNKGVIFVGEDRGDKVTNRTGMVSRLKGRSFMNGPVFVVHGNNH